MSNKQPNCGACATAAMGGKQPLTPCSKSAAPCRLNCRDIDFCHLHHGEECAFCCISARSQHLREHAWCDLPGDAPFVFAPTARTFLTTILHDGVPVAVGLLLIVCGDLEREG